jgi:hypothetical protein
MTASSSWRSGFPQSGNDTAALYTQLTTSADASVYKRSVQLVDGEVFFMVQEGLERKLVVVGEKSADKFTGTEDQVNGYQVKVCPLTTDNRKALQAIFDWLVPRAVGTEIASIGLGDRLGLASPGHIAAVRSRDVMPILAQQSIRELDLTGRNYTEVLDAAAWAVFQEGYTKGYGADGDHLKKPSDVQMALDLGFSMITLDCSEHINDKVSSFSDAEVDAEYEKLDSNLRAHFEKTYLNQKFTLKSGSTVKFAADSFRRMVLVYVHALDFAEDIYKNIVVPTNREIDFEMSIDEVATPTTPQDHFFVANELIARGVKFNSVAPRFVGEFQKGIDYIGDPKQFEAEFKIHAEIADHFGYKVSVHSGSDKFMVFGIVGKYTKGRFHVKTAGTNWLEAVRVIAMVNPGLYREMHQYALNNLDEAKKYYHVTFDPAAIPSLDDLSDEELPDLMNQDAARQAIHITYGILLQAKNADGSYLFKDRFYRDLITNSDLYSERLRTHIGKHLDLLNVKEK